MSDTEPTGTEQAQEGQAQATGTQYAAINAKTKFSKGAKALIGGAALATAGYVAARAFKRFVWPEKGKLKRGIQILLMGGTVYWATHCGSVNAKIGEFYNEKINPTVAEWKTGQEKISSLEQKALTLEESKTAVEANYQKTQEELKAEAEKAKKLELDNKLLQEKSNGLSSTLSEKDARLSEKDDYISKLEQQVREGMRKVDEMRQANAYDPSSAPAQATTAAQPSLQSRSPALEERAVASYQSGQVLKASGQKMPGALSKYEGKFASHFSYIIYVDKDENKLSLYKSSNGKLGFVKQYACSTGTNPNKKMQSGDKATPEGVFLAEYRNFSPVHTGLYGDGIVGLSTNFKGIVLCGADYPDRIKAIRESRNSTNGGVIMLNHDLNDLDSTVRGNYSNAAFVIEHSLRPLSLRFSR
ncbi:hypothetical protein JXB28_01215 [Candidatus Woesearchaeota archaeon]|nr:hypothetical protein [Candidatus Woesearchaeota archaeon]